MQTWIYAIFLFAFGASLGSFASAYIYRLRSRMGGLLNGRSMCPECHEQLLWYHMIPLISWLALGGKCQHCDNHIPKSYLYLEILFGLIFGAVSVFLLDSVLMQATTFGILLFFLFVVVFLGVYDGWFGEVPDRVSVSAIFVAFALLIIDVHISWFFRFPTPVYETTLIEGIVASVLIYSFFALQNIIAALLHFAKEKQLARLPGLILCYALLPFWWSVSLVSGPKEADKTFPSLDSYDSVPLWVGGGDLRYAIFIGLSSGIYLGWSSIFWGYIIGAVYGIVCIVTRSKNRAIPFVPFLAAGWLLALFLHYNI